MTLTTAQLSEKLGLSRATISRVLNGGQGVKPATISAVRQEMDRLGYVRPAVRPGRKPKDQRAGPSRHGAIALIVADTSIFFDDPGMANFVHSVQEACSKRGLHLLLERVSDNGPLPATLQRAKVDGALVMMFPGLTPEDDTIRRIAEQFPVVQVLAPGHPLTNVEHVTVNDVSIGTHAHLLFTADSCQSVVVINVWPSFKESLLIRSRACLDRSILAGRSVRVFVQDKNQTALWPAGTAPYQTFQQIIEVLRNLPKPVGVFLPIDARAKEFADALLAAGLGDPSQTRLVIAGVTPRLVDGIHPRPTLIDPNFEAVANSAIDRLLAVGGEATQRPQTVMVQPRVFPA
ncbi:LacI family transcriptional regulator [bacterium]|jgi:DNA-binding LacI/PurR family transcriptional regulator|nr:LacI family transcriptional regulator [bacterium]